MAGMKLLTKYDARLCLKAAYRAAQDLGFIVPAIDDASKRFGATKGNVFISALAGPFAPHCDFQITTEVYPDVNEIVLEINKPWLTTGAIGVRKVNEQAEELLRTIVRLIEKDGGTIIERKAF
jgi:hypothetical protein